MTRGTRIWMGVAVVFTLVNVGGAFMAAMGGELLHGASHVALAVLGAVSSWAILARSRRRSSTGDDMRELTSDAPGDPSLDNLQYSVDAIALEVERIGEAQRFREKLRTERVNTPI